MILFLSASFLRHLKLVWKPELKALLVGDRNLFFLIPEAVVEVSEISPETIDTFLKSDRMKGNLQLLGYIAAGDAPDMIGYAQVKTSGMPDPDKWTARLCLYEESGLQSTPLQIRTSQMQ